MMYHDCIEILKRENFERLSPHLWKLFNDDRNLQVLLRVDENKEVTDVYITGYFQNNYSQCLALSSDERSSIPNGVDKYFEKCVDMQKHPVKYLSELFRKHSENLRYFGETFSKILERWDFKLIPNENAGKQEYVWEPYFCWSHVNADRGKDNIIIFYTDCITENLMFYSPDNCRGFNISSMSEREFSDLMFDEVLLCSGKPRPEYEYIFYEGEDVNTCGLVCDYLRRRNLTCWERLPDRYKKIYPEPKSE